MFGKSRTMLIIAFSGISLLAKQVTASSCNDITYNLSTKNIQDSILNVEIILRGKFKEQMILNLPSNWAGAEYIQQIKNIQI